MFWLKLSSETTMRNAAIEHHDQILKDLENNQ